MAKPVKVAFNKNIVVLPLSAILPLRAVSFATKQSAKYLRIDHSMAEVGIIEPLMVAPMRQGQQQHLLLDGHMRLAILSDLGSAETRCLIADVEHDLNSSQTAALELTLAASESTQAHGVAFKADCEPEACAETGSAYIPRLERVIRKHRVQSQRTEP